MADNDADEFHDVRSGELLLTGSAANVQSLPREGNRGATNDRTRLDGNKGAGRTKNSIVPTNDNLVTLT